MVPEEGINLGDDLNAVFDYCRKIKYGKRHGGGNPDGRASART